jgi:N-methylhydantoinase A
VGQGYELTVPLADVPGSEADRAAIRAAFDAQHERLTGHAAPGERVEIVNYRLTAVAAVPHAPVTSPFAGTAEPGTAPAGSRPIVLDGARIDARLYDRTRLAPGERVEGPAILLQPDSTTIVHHGQTARVIQNGIVEITW